MKLNLRENIEGYLFISPWILGMVFFCSRADTGQLWSGVHALEPLYGARVRGLGQFSEAGARPALLQIGV